MRYAAYGGLAYEKPQSALRAFTTGTSVRFFSGAFCPLMKPLRGFFIAAVKTSHTTGTLCAIAPKLVKNNGIKNYCNIIDKRLLLNIIKLWERIGIKII
jgi:hypothetical protein